MTTMREELFKWDSGQKPPWGEVIGMYLALHGLRGFWPMSSVNESGSAIDLSAQARHLTRVTVTFNHTDTVSPFMPYASFNTDRYLYRADEAGLDILGSEAYINSAQRGLTVGCWIRPSTIGAGDGGIISKYNTSGDQRSYMLYRQNSSNRFRFLVSPDGSATSGQTTSLDWTGSTWHFVVGRFVPSTSISIYVNGTWDTNVTSIPAAIFNSSAAFEIGSYAAGVSASTWAHQQSLAFLCAGALSDAVINALYRRTRALFGV